MLDALDRVRRETTEDSDSAADDLRQRVTAIQGAAVAASIGWISLLSRAPSLLAAAASSLPMWQRVDPLAVLSVSDEERARRELDLRDAEEAEDRDDEAVGRLLDD